MHLYFLVHFGLTKPSERFRKSSERLCKLGMLQGDAVVGYLVIVHCCVRATVCRSKGGSGF